MNVVNQLYIQKQDTSIPRFYNLYYQLGVLCLEDGIPPFPSRTKDMVSQSWAGESGEDVYFPPIARYEGFDWKVKFCTKGKNDVGSSTTYTPMLRLKQIRNYLSGFWGDTGITNNGSPYTSVNALPSPSTANFGQIYFVQGTEDEILEYISVKSGNSYSWTLLGRTDNLFKSCSKFMVYSPLLKEGRQSCYLKDISDMKIDYTLDIIEFSLTFRICDPVNRVLFDEDSHRLYVE